jgi:uroporphyrinogen decarboxylase
MTPKERVLAAVRGGRADRVPVALHGLFVAAERTGLPFEKVFTDGALLAESQVALFDAVGHDVILLENGTSALAEACGCTAEYSESGSPVIVSRPIERLEDVKILKMPDPLSAAPLPELLKATEIVARARGKTAFVMGRADQAPFVLAAQLLGLETFLESLAIPERKRGLHALMEFCAEACLVYARAQLARGADGTSFGDSLSGPDVVSPELYREFAHPHARRVIEKLEGEGAIVAYHICGRTDAILPDMISLGASILEIDQKTDRILAAKAAAGKTCILGPIDPSSVIRFGLPEEVYADCRGALRTFAPECGLILSSGCDIPAGTSLENLRAIVRASEDFGPVEWTNKPTR